jgi:hypothetical protein
MNIIKKAIYRINIIRAKLRWKKWTTLVLSSNQNDAMVEIARLRWRVVHGGYDPSTEANFLKAIQIIEDAVKRVGIQTQKKRSSTFFDLENA